MEQDKNAANGLSFHLMPLPPAVDLETPAIFRRLNQANRHLAELKGTVKTIPNANILIDTLLLQEAKDSSEVENIVTTHDELFRAVSGVEAVSPATKEVKQYVLALRQGLVSVKNNGLIPNRLLLEMQGILEPNKAGVRKLPGTTLTNAVTGEIIYTPPQNHDDIIAHLSDLERFINDASVSSLDPLIKMALIHYQFESIHPFYDGNGRTGRILNVLYLVASGLLDIPVLYLSRYIIQYKSDYYRLLQEVRDQNAWEAWVSFMLDAVSQTARHTLYLVEEIRRLMQEAKLLIRDTLPSIYSQDLLNHLFRHPYTKISFLMADLQISRPTATKYLNRLAQNKIVQKHKLGRTFYYINEALANLLIEGAVLRQ
jgi:Fic family protein